MNYVEIIRFSIRRALFFKFEHYLQSTMNSIEFRRSEQNDAYGMTTIFNADNETDENYEILHLVEKLSEN